MDLSFGTDDLICAHFTLGGLEGQIGLEERASAAAGAGFRYLGWMGEAYRAEREAGRSDADIRAILDHHGVAVAEIEFLYGWSAAEPGFDWQSQERDLFALADAVGAHHLNCGDVGLTGPMLPVDAVAERFAGICDRAAEHGLQVGIEFLPWTEIPDASTAWDIARLAGRPNGGVLVDAWHHFRGSADLSQLAAIPPERIVVIQLDDAGPRQGELAEDTSYRRLPPGAGELDLGGLLRMLHDHGVRAPISVEVMSSELAARPVDEVARIVHDAAVAVIDAALAPR